MTDLNKLIFLVKDDKIAMIGFNITSNFGQVFNATYPNGESASQKFATVKETWEQFEGAVNLSLTRGWEIGYAGEANWG